MRNAQQKGDRSALRIPNSALFMRLIVGLGNPGIEYQFTPHNLGFLVVDRLAEGAGVRVERPEARALLAHAQIEGVPVVLAKPLTYMNLSGLAVGDLLARLELDPGALLAISDDIALPRGTLRIRRRGGAGGHLGLESIIGALGTEEFARLRLGVGPDHPIADAAEYVLRPFRRADLKPVDEQIERAAEAVRVFLRDGLEKAMSLFNRSYEL
jgi:PTH1 family peptidyl-tRNA hydrolase